MSAGQKESLEQTAYPTLAMSSQMLESRIRSITQTNGLENLEGMPLKFPFYCAGKVRIVIILAYLKREECET